MLLAAAPHTYTPHILVGFPQVFTRIAQTSSVCLSLCCVFVTGYDAFGFCFVKLIGDDLFQRFLLIELPSRRIDHYRRATAWLPLYSYADCNGFTSTDVFC